METEFAQLTLRRSAALQEERIEAVDAILMSCLELSDAVLLRHKMFEVHERYPPAQYGSVSVPIRT